MLRNQALGTTVFLLFLCLGFFWAVARRGERPGEADQAYAAASVEEDALAPRREVAADRADEEPPAGDVARSSLQVPVAPTAVADQGEFEPDAVYGRILDPDAQPVAGAQVLLFEGHRVLENVAAPIQATESSENGRFRFPGLDEYERYQVCIQADGFLPLVSTLWPGHDEEVSLGRSVTIRGHVLDAASGEPLANVVVVNNSNIGYWGDGGYHRFLSATSDAEGKYEMRWARLEGMQQLNVRRPGHSYERKEFQVDAERTDGYDLLLDTGTAVVLEVYDLETGLPVRDTELEVAVGHTVETDEAGCIALDSISPKRDDRRRLSLSFRAPGWCRTTLNKNLEDRPHQRIRVPLTRGARVHGRAVDAAGAPVAEARIYVRGQGRSYSTPRNRLAGLPPGTSLRDNEEPVLTDADGRFEKAGIVPGEKQRTVWAWHREHASSDHEEVTLRTAGDAAEVELLLANGGILTGTVRVDDQPVSTHVFWEAEDHNDWTRSNDQGHYRFRGVRPGEVQLNAMLDDHSWSNKESDPEKVWIEDGETLEHDIVIVSNRAVIAGTVHDSLGAPVAGANVWAWASGAEDFHFSTSTETGEDGAFELLVEAPVGIEYKVGASEGPRQITLTNVLPATTGLEIVLPELGELRLIVQDAGTREPVTGFSVFFRTPEEEGFRRLRQSSSSFSPGPDGSFLAQLPTGQLDLRVGARASGYPFVHVAGVRAAPEAPEPPTLVLLERGVTLVVTFAYEEGTRKPFMKWMRGRRISIANEEQVAEKGRGGDYFYREVQWAQMLRLDDSGRARVRGLAPATYSFLWQPPDLELVPDSFEIPHVDEHEVEIRVQHRPEEEQAESEEG